MQRGFKKPKKGLAIGFLVVSAAAFLCGCGGGGSGAAITPPTTDTPTTDTPTTDTPATARIPAQAVYNVTVRGTTYYGNNYPLAAVTAFTPAANFTRSGQIVIAPTLPKTGFNNGSNSRDVAIFIGTIGQAGAGNLHYATNTSLFSLIGATPPATLTALDVATVNVDESQGIISVRPDSTLFSSPNARTALLNLFVRTDSIVTSTVQILAGQMDINFSRDGSQITGSIDFGGETAGSGTGSIRATFTGTRSG